MLRWITLILLYKIYDLYNFIKSLGSSSLKRWDSVVVYVSLRFNKHKGLSCKRVYPKFYRRRWHPLVDSSYILITVNWRTQHFTSLISTLVMCSVLLYSPLVSSVLSSSVKMSISSLRWITLKVCCVRVHICMRFHLSWTYVCYVRKSVRFSSFSSHVQYSESLWCNSVWIVTHCHTLRMLLTCIIMLCVGRSLKSRTHWYLMIVVSIRTVDYRNSYNCRTDFCVIEIVLTV